MQSYAAAVLLGCVSVNKRKCSVNERNGVYVYRDSEMPKVVSLFVASSPAQRTDGASHNGPAPARKLYRNEARDLIQSFDGLCVECITMHWHLF